MQRRRSLPVTRSQVFILAIACLRAVPAMAQGPQSTPSILAPASTPAHEIYALSLFVLLITGAIFAVVGGLLAFVIIRFRARESDAQHEPAQIYGSTQVELAWTVIPVLIVVVLFLTTARIIFAIQDAPKPQSALDVTVVGHQFWWEFRYPKLGIVTANELHVPVSTSVDAGADISAAALGRCRSQLLGAAARRQNRSDSQPPKRNVDRSAERGLVSGPVRAVLRRRARQDAASRLRRYARSVRRVGESTAAARRATRRQDAVAGRHVFETEACVNCHTISGTAAKGTFGPDLTHLMSRATIAAGAADNTPENLRAWIRIRTRSSPAR